MLIVALVLVGCGGPKGLNTQYVEGVVTLDGQPLEKAMVTFVPESPGTDTKTAVGHTDSSGKYTLTSDGGLPQKGALEGNYKVTISKVEITTQAEDRSSTPPGGSRTPPKYSTQTVITPQVYSTATTTPLKATVQKGRNDIPFAMEGRK